MHIVTMVLIMLLAVVASGYAARLLPFQVPLPLAQIGMGALFAGAFGVEVQFEPHVFLLLFIPPLLFLDGWRIPKNAFFSNWRPIFALATGLVVFTVLGLGVFIHWLIPAVPLVVAFALAAILSPTDPVAVGAMTSSSPLPPRIMHILEGESLLNDATGLVCFSFAVTAALTGVFSLADASRNFVLVAGGGALVGLLTTWGISSVNQALIKRTGEEAALQTLISLLIPFAAYLVAEHMHVSGILAAVVGGFAMHYGERNTPLLATTRIRRRVVWDAIQTSLNGIIFVLLGAQLPAMLKRLPDVAETTGIGSAMHLVGYAFLITLALGVLRFTWVWFSMRMTLFRTEAGQARLKPLSVRTILVTATAGVRGAITYAGILTLPLVMADGTAFPARDIAIFLSMGVILLSLLIASVGLPILAQGLQQEDHDIALTPTESIDAQMRMRMHDAAVARIQAIISTLPTDTATQDPRLEACITVLEQYQRWLGHDTASKDPAELERRNEIEREVRLQALHAEHELLNQLHRAGQIDDQVHRRLIREVDLMEASLTREAGH